MPIPVNDSTVNNSNTPHGSTRKLTKLPSKKSSTSSYTQTDSGISPPGSTHMDSPEITTFSPVSALPSHNPSMIAQHGSDHFAAHDFKHGRAHAISDKAIPEDMVHGDWADEVDESTIPENDKQGHEGIVNDAQPKVLEIQGTPQVDVKPNNLKVDTKLVIKNDRVIALDFDDVCCQSLLAMCMEHNAVYGTDLVLEDIQSYAYFQNRGWGSMADVERKLQVLDDLLPKSSPVPGFASALKALHSLGHPLHIVTARPAASRPDVIKWLAQQGITVGPGPEDIIQEAWFVNTYSGQAKEVIGPKGDTESAMERENDLNERLREIWRAGVGKGKGGTEKLKVLREINASLFIDDHHGNLEAMIHADNPIPCLLFGSYAWNKSRSGVASPVELMSFRERLNAGFTLPKTEIELGEHLHRVTGWGEVVEWVREWDGGVNAHGGRVEGI